MSMIRCDSVTAGGSGSALKMFFSFRMAREIVSLLLDGLRRRDGEDVR